MQRGFLSFFGKSWLRGLFDLQLGSDLTHARRPAQPRARSEPDGAAPAGSVRTQHAVRFLRGGLVPAGAGDGAAGGSTCVIELSAARFIPGEKLIEAGSPVKPKVWLHPRLTDAQAWALADRLGCRMTWKGRGVALVPVHG